MNEREKNLYTLMKKTKKKSFQKLMVSTRFESKHVTNCILCQLDCSSFYLVGDKENVY